MIRAKRFEGVQGADSFSQLCRVVQPTVQTDTQCMDYHSPKRVPIHGIRASIPSSISMDARWGVTGPRWCLSNLTLSLWSRCVGGGVTDVAYTPNG